MPFPLDSINNDDPGDGAGLVSYSGSNQTAGGLIGGDANSASNSYSGGYGGGSFVDGNTVEGNTGADEGGTTYGNTFGGSGESNSSQYSFSGPFGTATNTFYSGSSSGSVSFASSSSYTSAYTVSPASGATLEATETEYHEIYLATTATETDYALLTSTTVIPITVYVPSLTTSINGTSTVTYTCNESIVSTALTTTASDSQTITAGSNSAVTTGNQFAHPELASLLLGPNEWVWSITATGADSSDVFALEDIAGSVGGDLWVARASYSVYAIAAQPGPYAYAAGNFEGTSGSYTFTQTTSTVTTGTISGVSGGQLPTPTFSSTGGVPTSTTLTYSQALRDGVGTYTVEGYGASTTSAIGFLGQMTCTAPAFAYDASGNITGTMTSMGSCSFQSSVVLTVAAPWVNNGSGSTTYGYTSVDTLDGATGSYTITSTSSAAGAAESLYSMPLTSPGFVPFMPNATVIEATFAPAYRLGTDGKCDQIIGPDASIYYPWFSQVWNGLQTPMTFAETKSAVAAQTQSTTAGYGYYETFPGPLISTLKYSWASTGRVSVSETISDTVSGTSTTSSTRFTLGSAQENNHSFYETRPEGGAFAIGGSQWDDNPAIAWLGRGRWGVTLEDGLGGTTAATLTVTDQISIVSAGRGTVLACEPLPAWSLASIQEGDSSIGFGNYVVVPKWSYN
jgi:hypothetical protein